MIEELKDIKEFSVYESEITKTTGAKKEFFERVRKPHISEIQDKINEIIRYLNEEKKWKNIIYIC